MRPVGDSGEVEPVKRRAQRRPGQKTARLWADRGEICVALHDFDRSDLAVLRSYGAYWDSTTRCWILSEPAARVLAEELGDLGFTVRARWPK